MKKKDTMSKRKNRSFWSNRKNMKILIGVFVLAFLWIGVNFYVMNLEEFRDSKQAFLHTSDTTSPGGEMPVQVVVNDRETGEPYAEEPVTVRLTSSPTETVARGETDEHGTFSTEVDTPEENGSYQIEANVGGIFSTESVKTNFEVDRDYRILIDTDKPIYQQGQDINIRTLVRDMGGNPVEDKVNIEVEGPEGTKFFNREIETNEFGMLQTEFPLSEVADQGRYRIIASYDNAELEETIEVDEYTLPEFEIITKTDESYYEPGETVELQINAEYFFGEPVADGNVTIRGEGYIGALETFTQKSTSLNEEGKAEVEIELPSYFVGTPEEEGLGVAIINVTVTDQAGDSEATTQDIRISEGDIIVNAFPAGGALVMEAENDVFVTTRTPDGQPISSKVEVVKTGTGDSFEVETNEYGLGMFSYTPETSRDRTFDLYAESHESPGVGEDFEWYETRYGEGEVAFDDRQAQRIAVVIEEASYDVGDTVSGEVIVGKGGGTAYIDVIDSEQTHTTMIADVEDSRASFDFDVTPQMAGSIEVRAWSIFQNTEVASASSIVPIRHQTDLEIEIDSNEDEYEPGEEAVFTITTTEDGEPVPSAVGIDIVDESVFAVGQERKGLAAINFQVEQELLEPSAWIYEYTPKDLTKPKPIEKDETEDMQRSPDAFVPHGALEAADVDPQSTDGNSYVQEEENIEERQESTTEMNGILVALLLIILPLSILALGFINRDKESLKTKIKEASLGIGGVIVLGGFFVFLLFLLEAFTTSPLLAFIIGGALGIGFIYACVRLAMKEKSGLWSGLLTALILYALVLVALFFFEDVIATGLIESYIWLIILAAAVFPLATAYFGSKITFKGEYLYGTLIIMFAALMVLPGGAALISSMTGTTEMAAGPQSVAVDEGVAVPESADAPVRAPEPVEDIEDTAPEEDVAETPDGEEVEVRDFFPETLYSDIVLTGEEGEETLNIGMADSITSWQVDALGSTREGVAGSAQEHVTVFQPFFIQPQLPVSLTQNDTITIPVSVFNYEEEALEITVELEDRDWFSVDKTQETIFLEANSVDSVDFTITAEENGEYDMLLAASGEGVDSQNISADAIERTVTVEPHGKQFINVDSGVLEKVEQKTSIIPEYAVDGSEKAVVTLHPGVFGQVIDGMDALLRMPTGCFEQTSSALYPNIMALQYMEDTDTINPEIRMQAERFISQGYQRILGFEVRNGGYSVFGRDPPKHSVTSYGLKMFTDMDEVYSVDPQVKEEMFNYVAGEQKADGSWEVDGDASYVVGIDDKFGLTAFITWSLATYDSDSREVSNAIDYLVREINIKEETSRNLGLMLNVLSTAEKDRSLQRDIATELNTRFEKTDEGLKLTEETEIEMPGRRGGDSIEAIATATLGLVETGLEPSLAEAGLQEIIEQKTDRGWGTTQGTVMSLKALTSADQMDETAEEGTITIKHQGNKVYELELDEDSSNEAHIAHFELEKNANEISIEGPEDSGYQYDLETRFHIPWEEADEDPEGIITLDVEYNRTELTVDDSVEVTATMTVKQGEVGMAIVDVGVPPGFDPKIETLEEAEEKGQIMNYEIAGRQIVLYLEDIRGEHEVNFDIIARQPIDASSGSSSAYDYYNPEEEAEQGPVNFAVR